MLAYKPPAFVESVLSGPLKRFTSKTIVSRAALQAELVTIRKDSCAVDDEEMEGITGS
jgi:DNA-binding IclR family transcriptional regulator